MEREDPVVPAVDLAGARILIVEDQGSIAVLLQSAVAAAGGHVVATAGTIDSALDLIASEKISAAVITMIAGGVYTDEVARELMRRGIPYVVTTGIGADASHPELHGAVTITKPFQATHVQGVLADMLTHQR